MSDEELAPLREDAGIVRNRLKIASARSNARAILELQRGEGSFAAYLWNFVDGRPIINNFETLADVPASTPLSDRLSKDMKRRGFSFVGTTITYAFMQGIGMVNDHVNLLATSRRLGDRGTAPQMRSGRKSFTTNISVK